MSKRPCQSPCPGASEDKPADKKLRATIAPDVSAASSSSSTTERPVRFVAQAGMRGFFAGECPKGYVAAVVVVAVAGEDMSGNRARGAGHATNIVTSHHHSPPAYLPPPIRNSYVEGSAAGAMKDSISPRVNILAAAPQGSQFLGPVPTVDGAPLNMNNSTRGSPKSVEAFNKYLATHYVEGEPTIVVACGPGSENGCTAILGNAQNSKTHQMHSLESGLFEKSQLKALPAARAAFHNGDASAARASIVGVIMITPIATEKKNVDAATRTCTAVLVYRAPHAYTDASSFPCRWPAYVYVTDPSQLTSCPALYVPPSASVVQAPRRCVRCRLALASSF